MFWHITIEIRQCYYIIVSPIIMYTGTLWFSHRYPATLALHNSQKLKNPYWIASTFDMYIDVDENITALQAGPSLDIGPPIIHCCTLWPFMKNWLLILILVVHILLCVPTLKVWYQLNQHMFLF